MKEKIMAVAIVKTAEQIIEQDEKAMEIINQTENDEQKVIIKMFF